MIFLLFLASVIGLRFVLSKDPAPAVEIAVEPILQNALAPHVEIGSDLSHLASALQQWGAPTAPTSLSHPASPQVSDLQISDLPVDSKSVVRPS